ncbi:MAG: sulfotransferase [Magnetococcus sp. WYHC-3]
MDLSHYSLPDRWIHRLAFATLDLQEDLSRLESRLFQEDMTALPTPAPVFITSLARAGTTLLLELLEQCGEFACHTYRNMPFVFLPLLWDQVSRKHRVALPAVERAHGDGMTVHADSPEAFEEILWKHFWPEKYPADRILTWNSSDRNARFESFYADHIRKVTLLNRRVAPQRRRYLAKNNVNITRLTWLPRVFPQCKIVVPVRDPVSHVTSLVRQHQRFMQRHQEDAFASRYMDWLGHHEFGSRLKPCDFDNWLGSSPRDTLRPDFWYDYWSACHRSLLTVSGPHVLLFDYNAACRDPTPHLRELARFLELAHPEALLRQAARFRAPRGEQPPPDEAATALEIYRSLQEKMRCQLLDAP